MAAKEKVNNQDPNDIDLSSRSLIVNDEIDLAYLFNLLWKRKFLVIMVSSVFTFSAIIYAQSLPNLYRSEALLAPAGVNGNAGNFPSQLGGLAGFAGLSFGGPSTDKIAMALAILKSRTFLDNFVSRYDLAKPIMFAQSWDFGDQKWRYDSSVIQSKYLKYSRQKLYKKLKSDILIASQDPKTGFVRLSVELMSPIEAQRWVDLLIKDINKELRARDIKEAKGRIRFLREQLEKTEVTGMQQVFYQLIEQQLKTVMLAEVADEYVLKVIDEPIIPEDKSKPHKALIVATGALIGFVVAVLLALIVSFRKRGN